MFMRLGIQPQLLLDEYDQTVHRLMLTGVLCNECRHWLRWSDAIPPGHKA